MKAEYKMNHRINKLSVLAMALVLAGCKYGAGLRTAFCTNELKLSFGSGLCSGTVSAAQTAGLISAGAISIVIRCCNNYLRSRWQTTAICASRCWMLRPARSVPDPSCRYAANTECGCRRYRYSVLPADVSLSGTTQITRSYDVNGAVSARELDFSGDGFVASAIGRWQRTGVDEHGLRQG